MSKFIVNHSISVAALVRHIHNIEPIKHQAPDVMIAPLALTPGRYEIQFDYSYSAPEINQGHELNEQTTLFDILLLAAKMFEDNYGILDPQTKSCLPATPMYLKDLEVQIRDFSLPVEQRGPGFITTAFFDVITIDKQAKTIHIAMGN